MTKNLRQSVTTCFGLVLVLATTSCGRFQKDDGDGGSTPVDKFELNNTEETTRIPASGLSTVVNAETILGVLQTSQLLRLVPQVPAISRMKSADFAACVTKRLADAPLNVTPDTLSVQYDFDLIAACDEAIAPEDKIVELSNRVTGKFAIICQGAGFTAWEGKTWGAAADAGLERNCRGQQIQFASSFEISARKRQIIVKADKTESQRLIVHSERSSLTSPNGAPCSLNVQDKVWKLEPCRKTSYQRKFDGEPEGEGRSPNDASNPPVAKPVVIQSQIGLDDTQWFEGDRYFRAGRAEFVFNGWHGTMAYSNGWAAPTWNARSVDPNNPAAEITANGVFGKVSASLP